MTFTKISEFALVFLLKKTKKYWKLLIFFSAYLSTLLSLYEGIHNKYAMQVKKRQTFKIIFLR